MNKNFRAFLKEYQLKFSENCIEGSKFIFNTESICIDYNKGSFLFWMKNPLTGDSDISGFGGGDSENFLESESYKFLKDNLIGDDLNLWLNNHNMTEDLLEFVDVDIMGHIVYTFESN